MNLTEIYRKAFNSSLWVLDQPVADRNLDFIVVSYSWMFIYFHNSERALTYEIHLSNHIFSVTPLLLCFFFFFNFADAFFFCMTQTNKVTHTSRCQLGETNLSNSSCPLAQTSLPSDLHPTARCQDSLHLMTFNKWLFNKSPN